MKEKVLVGLSGGVDSAAAAFLLKEQGYEVIGVTMALWQEDAQAACEVVPDEEKKTVAADGAADARAVAEALDIPFYIMDFRAEFKRCVVDYFIAEYERGYTPNPCTACNRFVKWEALFSRAKELGADYIATGHYAQIKRLSNGRYTVCNSATADKDQTYALYNLTQEQLSHTLMPVGAYGKDEIRELAKRAGLPVASKRDSQDICFIPDHDYAGFIARQTGREGTPGRFVDESGAVLGAHRGLIHYTVGQRKGLGISAETPLFVKELNCDTNEVVLCKSESLFSNICCVSGINCMAAERIDRETEAVGKIRYSHRGAPCVLSAMENGWLKCTFFEPQRAMTPGQAAVFYENGHILCGGTIERMQRNLF